MPLSEIDAICELHDIKLLSMDIVNNDSPEADTMVKTTQLGIDALGAYRDSLNERMTRYHDEALF